VNNTLLGETRDYKYFFVVESPPALGRTTSIYRIVNRTSRCSIGIIAWHGLWRQFCLFPREATIWSAGCLSDAQDAIRWAEEKHKERRGKL